MTDTSNGKVKFGLSNVHIAKRTETGGKITYEAPVALPGAVSASIDSNSNQNIFYADNIAYFTSNSKTSKKVELTVADIANAIMKDYLGYVDNKAGGIVETNKPTNGAFALLFQIETDAKARKFCFFNCTASESGEEYGTMEDKTDPVTSKLSVTCLGDAMSNGYVGFRNISNPGDANYDTFFTAVTAPEEGTAGA